MPTETKQEHTSYTHTRWLHQLQQNGTYQMPMVQPPGEYLKTVGIHQYIKWAALRYRHL